MLQIAGGILIAVAVLFVIGIITLGALFLGKVSKGMG